ncbi:exosome complex component RRP42 [Tanacetum coccineum]|uniref:Ribosomal RNA-processing protein 42 n=1 Tax=Tanacetum coccineum TaxID=301880 RepID=A0ABQ4XJ70_9ASTR
METGVTAQANGSARVKMGGTEVIASVKAELGRPSSSPPDKRKVSIYIDCSPTAAPEFCSTLDLEGTPLVQFRSKK